jgi:hypothetical protein
MLPAWLALLLSLVLGSLLVPSVRASVFAADDYLDRHERGLARVAIRASLRPAWSHTDRSAR